MAYFLHSCCSCQQPVVAPAYICSSFRPPGLMSEYSSVMGLCDHSLQYPGLCTSIGSCSGLCHPYAHCAALCGLPMHLSNFQAAQWLLFSSRVVCQATLRPLNSGCLSSDQRMILSLLCITLCTSILWNSFFVHLSHGSKSVRCRIWCPL